MYTAMLLLHSWWRWVTVGASLYAAFRFASAKNASEPWTSTDQRAGLAAVATMDLQVLFGLVMYFAVSPITIAARQHMGAAMRDKVTRFWAVEHLFVGLVALVAVHVFWVRVKRVQDVSEKRSRAARGFGVVGVLALAAALLPVFMAGRGFIRLG